MADAAALATNTVFRVEPRKPTEPRGTLFVNRSAPVPMVRSIAGETQRLAVLERFSVESAGDQLRIVDADGSVYEGNLSAVPATRTAAARRATESTAVRGGGSVPLAAPSSGALGRSGPAAPAQKAAPAVSAPRDGAVAPPVELAFQALGTNRSTRQLVQIEGRLVVTNQSVPGVPPEDLRSGARPEVLQNLLRQSVLRGQARLGEPHATIPIEAVPTGP